MPPYLILPRFSKNEVEFGSVSLTISIFMIDHYWSVNPVPCLLTRYLILPICGINWTYFRGMDSRFCTKSYTQDVEILAHNHPSRSRWIGQFNFGKLNVPFCWWAASTQCGGDEQLDKLACFWCALVKRLISRSRSRASSLLSQNKGILGIGGQFSRRSASHWSSWSGGVDGERLITSRSAGA